MGGHFSQKTGEKAYTKETKPYLGLPLKMVQGAMMNLQIGDYVYYVDKNRDTIPCVIKAIKNKKALISAGFASGKYTRWVKLTNCELQEER